MFVHGILVSARPSSQMKLLISFNKLDAKKAVLQVIKKNENEQTNKNNIIHVYS